MAKHHDFATQESWNKEKITLLVKRCIECIKLKGAWKLVGGYFRTKDLYRSGRCLFLKGFSIKFINI